MTRLIRGVGEFQQQVYEARKELFEELKDGQKPLALFITCADSRIDPNLLTQTAPGELFVLRNAGNMVPPSGAMTQGEGATIEYAVSHLKVRDVILCGHSQCGAMGGLLAPQAVAQMTEVAKWLQFADNAVARARRRVTSDNPQELLNEVIGQNVLVQVEHILSYPAVRAAAASDAVRLHAWVYEFEHGIVKAYDAAQDKFVPLGSTPYKLLIPVSDLPSPSAVASASSSTASPAAATPPARKGWWPFGKKK